MKNAYLSTSSPSNLNPLRGVPTYAVVVVEALCDVVVVGASVDDWDEDGGSALTQVSQPL